MAEWFKPNEIFKIQRQLVENNPRTPMLICNRDRSIMLMPTEAKWPELRAAMGDRPKIYVTFHLKNGKVLFTETNHQPW